MVDDAGDVITEALTGGTDLVKTSIDYSLLEANLENLTLDGLLATSMPRATPWPTSSRAMPATTVWTAGLV